MVATPPRWTRYPPTFDILQLRHVRGYTAILVYYTQPCCCWMSVLITNGSYPGCWITYVDVIGLYTHPCHTGDKRPCHGGYIPVSQGGQALCMGNSRPHHGKYTPMSREIVQYSHGLCYLTIPMGGIRTSPVSSNGLVSIHVTVSE